MNIFIFIYFFFFEILFIKRILLRKASTKKLFIEGRAYYKWSKCGKQCFCSSKHRRLCLLFICIEILLRVIYTIDITVYNRFN